MANTFPNMIRTCTVNGRPCGCAPTEACRMVPTHRDVRPAPLPAGSSDLVHREPAKPAPEPVIERGEPLVIEPVANGFLVHRANPHALGTAVSARETLVFQDLGHSDGTEDASLLSFLKHHFAAQEDR